MTQSVGFLKSFTGCCCGRYIFYTLRHHSWGRTLLHLFLLSLITGIIIGQVKTERFRGQLETFQAVFTGIFGEEIYVTPQAGNWNWIAPVQNPLAPRETTIPGGGKFYYTGNARKIPASLKNVTGTAVVWSPEMLGIAVPAGHGTFNCVTVRTATGEIDRFTGTPASLEKIFTNAPAGIPRQEMLKKESVSEFFSGLSALLSFFLCAGTVIWNFFLAVLYTGIFMLMYRLLNGPSGRLRFLSLQEMWKCGIYASFPAMAVAAFFPVLELPFVSYETVFMVGLLIYWMSVTAYLERTSPEQEEQNNEQ